MFSLPYRFYNVLARNRTLHFGSLFALPLTDSLCRHSHMNLIMKESLVSQALGDWLPYHDAAFSLSATAHRALIIWLNTQSHDCRKTMSNPTSSSKRNRTASAVQVFSSAIMSHMILNFSLFNSTCRNFHLLFEERPFYVHKGCVGFNHSLFAYLFPTF